MGLLTKWREGCLYFPGVRYFSFCPTPNLHGGPWEAIPLMSASESMGEAVCRLGGAMVGHCVIIMPWRWVVVPYDTNHLTTGKYSYLIRSITANIQRVFRGAKNKNNWTVLSRGTSDPRSDLISFLSNCSLRLE